MRADPFTARLDSDARLQAVPVDLGLEDDPDGLLEKPRAWRDATLRGDLEPDPELYPVHRAMAVYRCLRHAAIASGCCAPTDPLSVPTESFTQPAEPLSGEGPRAVTPAVAATQLTALVEVLGGVPSTPPGPVSAPAGEAVFRELIWTTARALRLERRTQLRMELGMTGLDRDDPWRFAVYWPSPEELQDAEVRLFDVLADRALTQTDDGLRRYLTDAAGCVPFESYALVRGAREWGSRLRPEEPERDRALHLRQVESVIAEAQRAGDHRTALQGLVLSARIQGFVDRPDSAQEREREALAEFAAAIPRLEAAARSVLPAPPPIEIDETLGTLVE